MEATEENGEGDVELQQWPAPENPVCVAADHNSLVLEWPRYEQPEDAFTYTLEVGFSLFPSKTGGSKKKLNQSRNDLELKKYCISCLEYSPDGFSPSVIGGSGHSMKSSESLVWKPVYTGTQNSGKIDALLPGMGYVFRVCIVPNSLTTVAPPSPSEEVLFFTVPSPPGPPEPPVLVDRGRTSLKLKWSAPMITGGMPMIHYCLEMKRANGHSFEKAYEGTNLTAKVTRLEPGVSYIFRIKTANSLGSSGYSKEIKYFTAPSVPGPPPPPTLLSSTPSSITVSWEEPHNHGSPIDSYIVEVDDGAGGPFSTAYTGSSQCAEVKDLTSGRAYKFRVLACNEIGKGAFSLPATLSTSESPPSAPYSLSIHGRTTTGAVVSWNIPEHDGGSPITGYGLEINMKTDGKSWTHAYAGESNTHTLVGLRPGFQYRVRVRAKNCVGFGEYSREGSFTTLPGPPEAPAAPEFADVLSNSVKVTWSKPSHDGGTTVVGYRLEMLNGEDFICAYRGAEFFAVINELNPGQKYLFRVQAMNKAGSSAWSDVSEIRTKAAEPEVPEAPIFVNISPTSISLRWNTPYGNGCTVSSYRLQMAVIGYGVREDPDKLHVSLSGGGHYIVEKNYSDDQRENDKLYTLQCVYEGPATSYTVKNLQPYTSYAFSLQAFNSVGGSPHGKISLVTTSSSSPAQPEILFVVESSSDKLVLRWKFPERDNGAEVTHFSLEMKNDESTSYKNNAKQRRVHGDAYTSWTEVYHGSSLSSEVSGLLPGHTYIFRLAAYNKHGPSTPSELTATTNAACPSAPKSPIFSGILPTSTRVRWAAPTCDNGAPLLWYKLLMDSIKPGHMQKVYEGPSTSHKVGKLTPGRSYQVAVQVINSVGASELSEFAYVTLPHMCLPTLDAPKVEHVSEDHISLTWKEAENVEAVSYTLQVETAPGKFVQIYEGSSPRFDMKVKHGPVKTYKFRVRANGGAETGPGPWSSISTWTHESSSSKPVIKENQVSKSTPASYKENMKALYQHLMEPWSLKTRRIIMVSGVMLTLMYAYLENALSN